METEKDITAKLSVKKIVIPVLLGLGAATFLLWYNLNEVRFESVIPGTGQFEWVDINQDGEVDLTDADEFIAVENGDYSQVTYKQILGKTNWTWYSAFWFLMALICVVIRDAAYMYRIRVLTDNALSWRQSFDVIMIWEFASALTPSIVGGSGVALFILNREGIKLGKSTAIVMITALLDELFYISMVPLVLITIGTANLFPVSMEKEIFGVTFGTQGIFWLGYGFIVLLTSIITLAIFYRPRAFKFVLIQIFRLPFLKRWRYSIIELGNDIIIASKELKGKPRAFWTKAIVSTYFSWTARFIVVNMMIMAVIPVANHVLLYGRQLVMWVIMLISPTPGGSGIAEFAFSGFLADFIPLGLAGGMAFIWRLLTYYPYIFVGAIVLPRWLRRTARESAIRKSQPQAPQF
jgi:glycosyltransferase 2 family protein